MKLLEKKREWVLQYIIDFILDHPRKVKLVIKDIDNVNVQKDYKISA